MTLPREDDLMATLGDQVDEAARAAQALAEMRAVVATYRDTVRSPRWSLAQQQLVISIVALLERWIDLLSGGA